MAYSQEPVAVVCLDGDHRKVVIEVSRDGSMGHEDDGEPKTVFRATFVDDPVIGFGASPSAAMCSMARVCDTLATQLRAESAVVATMKVVNDKLVPDKVMQQHAIPALRALAKQRCNRKNCGTVCLCDSCHARVALETLDPKWRP